MTGMIPILALAAFTAFACRALMDMRPLAGQATSPAARAIARTRQRLVHGEIDRSEYERIVRVLTD